MGRRTKVRLTSRPNILVTLTDQQSATMMSIAGNPWLRTPALDSLADSGVRFERAYCTNPVCIASRFSLLTGRMPNEIGMISNSTEEVSPLTAAQRKMGLGYMLRAAGYVPAYGGKVHLPHLEAQDLGFEVICQDERDELARVAVEYLQQPHSEPFCLFVSLINPHDICLMALRDHAATAEEKRLVAVGMTETEELDRALVRPRGVPAEEFFAMHCPPLPANHQPQADEPEILQELLDQRPFRRAAAEKWSPQRWREHRWAYARLTERVDRQIGVVLAALRASGQMDNTLIVFTSDHGDMDAAHRLEHKSTLYEEVCNVPLLVCPPGSPGRGRVDRTHLVSNGLDLLPTLCDYAGVPAPVLPHGRSLRPLLDGDGTSWRESLPVEAAVGRMIVTPRFKYCRYELSANGEQLLDRVDDPGEMRNALHDPQHAAVVQELREEFARTFGTAERDQEAVLWALVNS